MAEVQNKDISNIKQLPETPWEESQGVFLFRPQTCLIVNLCYISAS
jgi:hypothetical protein